MIEEEAFLGSVLLDNRSLYNVNSALETLDFSVKSYGEIYEKMRELASKNKPIDVAVLASCGFSSELLSRLTSASSIPAHIDSYAQIIKEGSRKRALKSIGSELLHMSESKALTADECVYEAERRILSIRAKEVDGHTRSVGDLSDELYEMIEERRQSGENFFGHRTGLTALDELTGGMQDGEVFVVAGRPSMGKSSVATQILLNRAAANAPCLFFSLEMSHHMCGLRMLSQISGIPMSLIKTGRLLGNSVERFAEARRKMKGLPIWIDDTGSITVPKIISTCRRIQSEAGGLSMVVVDYLQLCGGTTRDGRERDVAEASSGLKALAKEFNLPVVVLSQLNRSCEARPDKRPMLSDLRESGAIEQDADCVIMVYRHAAYDSSANPGEVELIVRKNRNGPLGTVTVQWDPSSMGVRDFNETSRGGAA